MNKYKVEITTKHAVYIMADNERSAEVSAIKHILDRTDLKYEETEVINTLVIPIRADAFGPFANQAEEDLELETINKE